MKLTELPDARAIGLPDEPYSAYCRVCWQSVYAIWVEKAPHNGLCPFGATDISGCEHAVSWERFKGNVRKKLAASRALEDKEQ